MSSMDFFHQLLSSVWEFDIHFGIWQIILPPSRTSSPISIHALKTQLTINIPAVQGRFQKKKNHLKLTIFPNIL